MSALGDGKIATNALEIEDCASDWIARRYLGEWSAHDEAELKAWLVQSLAHEIAFLRLEAGWGRTERLAALRPQKLEKNKPNTATRRSLAARMATITALLAVTGIIGALYLPRTSHEIYSTPLGGHRTVILADGSRMELNTNTLVHASFGHAERNIELLKGEVYFQVKHDAAWPFVVMAAGHRVTDLGTKFLVRNEANRLEVSLLEGRVELRSSDTSISPHSLVLMPGDVAVADAESLSVAKKPAAVLAGALGWRNGVLIFHDTTLADAVAEFNRYNSRKLVIADVDAARRIIGATFPIARVDLFANAVRNVLGLRVVSRGNEIIISR